MIITGIIVEYNPLHNGHIYHIKKAKELTNCDILVAIMSPNIVQRGEFAVIDKYRRTEFALKNGVDLVIELPSIFVLQNASKFAFGAIKLLSRLNLDYLVFGSETNDLDYLRKLANVNINLDYMKEIMKSGVSYPSAYGKLTNELYPNDILAICYLKELKKYPNITPLCIQRTNDYNGMDINSDIASASAIRVALKSNENISHTTPMYSLLLNYHNNNDNYFALVKYILSTSEANELKKYLLVDEGIENHLIKQIQFSVTYQDFIKRCTTRRYTSSKIQRTVLNILLKNKKSGQKSLEKLKHLRILGFNNKGKELLKNLKNYSVKFNKLPRKQKDLEFKIARLYALYYQDQDIINREKKGPVFDNKIIVE